MMMMMMMIIIIIIIIIITIIITIIKTIVLIITRSLTSIPLLMFFFGLFDLSFHSKPQNKLLLLKWHTSILIRRVLLSQLVHAQRQSFEGTLKYYLK